LNVSGNASNLACIDWQESEEHRPFNPAILGRQVAATTDIQALSVTGSMQP